MNKLKEDKEAQGKHYDSLKIDPQTYAYENKLDCFQFQVIKYVTRHELKNGEQDLEKAIQTLNKYKHAKYGK